MLAEPATAAGALPPFDNSSMDGYAVHASDVAAAADGAPVTLPVADQIPAGDSRILTVAPGTCARIMTGALLPGGADAVVPVEWTSGGTGQVQFFRPVSKRSCDTAARRRCGCGRRTACRRAPGSGRRRSHCWRPAATGPRYVRASTTGRGDRNR